jgi:hypothetical protein
MADELQQIMDQLHEYTFQQINRSNENHGFFSESGLLEASIIGREGSTHYRKEDARRALQFFDDAWNMLYEVAALLDKTEPADYLSIEDYLQMLITSEHQDSQSDESS